jgi:hypothetical protein
MKKFMKIVMLGAVAFAGCATAMTVRSDYVDPSKDLSVAKTYAWEAVGQKNELVTDAVDQWIREAVDGGFRAKGYQTDAAAPDLGLRYEVTVEKKEEKLNIGQPYSPVDVQRGVVRMDPTWQAYNRIKGLDTLRYEEGTLILDVLDPVTKKLLWRSSVSAVIDRGASPEKRKARIGEAVGKMLASFPAKSVKG